MAKRAGTAKSGAAKAGAGAAQSRADDAEGRLIDAALRLAAGLPEDLALRLARATVAGSGELARLSPEPAARLRESVTSPGGTTRAALDVLMAADGLQPLLTRAVLAAARRSRELAD